MPNYSREIQRLQSSWRTSTEWPKWLDWIEIAGLRGWTGQRLDFRFPIVAIVGENGAGKSTVLQSIASIYRAASPTEKTYFASEFFPDTAWDQVTGVQIRYTVREGENNTPLGSVRKPTSRWLGNPERRQRAVRYIDLRRIQPIIARTGYQQLAKGTVTEAESEPFDTDKLTRLSHILGKPYGTARHSRTSVDVKRWVPVTEHGGSQYSGFHQGAGETTVVDLLRTTIPNTAIVLIDEVETSLHPRAQRKLIRDLAVIARTRKLQIVLTTHSPYVLEELPPEARLQILTGDAGRRIVTGVSAEFAMTRMDDDSHPELEIYVEDRVAMVLIRELLARKRPESARRVMITPFGSAQVGKSLGVMAEQGRFSRPTRVVLDGDQDPSPGCIILPGGDAPERVVFEALDEINWTGVSQQIGRSHSDLVDAAQRAMTTPYHHDWLRVVGDDVLIGGEELWRAMVAAWIENVAGVEEGFSSLLDSIDEALEPV